MLILRSGSRKDHGMRQTTGSFTSRWVSTRMGGSPGVVAHASMVRGFAPLDGVKAKGPGGHIMDEPVLHNWHLEISLEELRGMIEALANGLDRPGGEAIGAALQPCLHHLLRLASACVPPPNEADTE